MNFQKVSNGLTFPSLEGLVSLPKIDLPKFDFPKLNLPETNFKESLLAPLTPACSELAKALNTIRKS